MNISPREDPRSLKPEFFDSDALTALSQSCLKQSALYTPEPMKSNLSEVEVFTSNASSILNATHSFAANEVDEYQVHLSAMRVKLQKQLLDLKQIGDVLSAEDSVSSVHTLDDLAMISSQIDQLNSAVQLSRTRSNECLEKVMAIEAENFRLRSQIARLQSSKEGKSQACCKCGIF